MTTATDTRPELVEAPAEDEPCCCIWWVKGKQVPCKNAAQYEVLGHSFEGGIEPCIDGVAGKICGPCLEKALKRICVIHHVPAVYSYTGL